VEDNSTDVFLVKEALTAHRVNVQLVVLEDGEEAMDLFSRLDADEGVACPDMILLDLNIPKADGFKVLQSIRSSTRSSDVPVVITTSSAALADRMKAAELGATAYFQKPTGYDAFLKLGEMIQRLLSR